MKSSHRSTRAGAVSDQSHTLNGWSLLTRFAFLLAVALVVARMMMSETLRAPGDAFPGQDRAPLSPGPATGLILDLLAWLPALLVLIRRAFDRSYSLRWSWACAAALLLGLWAVVSVAWSADRFAAVVSSFHWLSAMILLWSASQLVTSWLRLRIVAGACAGLLIVLTVSGYYFRIADWPDLKRAWIEQKSQILKEHHWEPDGFDARQFEKNILNGDILGFSTSSNTYAALLVLLGTVTAGIGIDKSNGRTRTNTQFIVIGTVAAILLATLPTLFWARSRGAAATTLLTVACIAAFAWSRRTTRDSRKIYWAAVFCVLAGFAAVVGLGLYHGTLFHSSLTFRWRYWVGASRLLAAHPFLGVGWENFGPRYLAVRLLLASEEVRDPHNFIVRIFAELGLIGGVLLIIWMLRMWWELTQQEAHHGAFESAGIPSRHPIVSLACVAIGAIAINLLASVDFSSSPAFVFLEIMKRGVFLICILAGVALAGLRSARDSGKHVAAGQLEFELDDRPAPWMLYSILIALGMFLIHNLIDFALFEPGPMFLFALLAGSALGMRSSVAAGSVSRRWAANCALIGLSTAWIVAAVAIAFPIAAAEGLAHDADDAIRSGRADDAAAALKSAFDRVPCNGDYAFRAALMAQAARQNPKVITELLDAAVADDPASVNYLRRRAEFFRLANPHQLQRAADDYALASKLDPNNVDLHRQLAGVLEALGDRHGAVVQFHAALRADDGLEPGDPKRLNTDKRLEIEAQIKSLDRL